MPPDFAWGQMMDAFVPIAIAGLIVLVGLTIAVRSYIRTLDAVVALMKEKQPAEWQARMKGNWARRPAGWIYRQALGFSIPDTADEDCKRLVFVARSWLLVSFALFAVLIIGLGWFTQGTMR